MRRKIPDAVSPKRVAALLADTKEQRKDRYFAIHGPDLREKIDGGRWTLGPVVRTRDSDVLDRVNYEALKKELAAANLPQGTYEFHQFNHFAVGWIERLCFMVVTAKGDPTKVCRFMEAWNEELEHYGCADDNRLAELEREELVEYLTEEYGTWTDVTRRPEDYIDIVCEKFSLSRKEDLSGWQRVGVRSLKRTVVQDQVEQFMFDQGWLYCDECNGCGMVPHDPDCAYPEDEVFPGYESCYCDAFDFWDFDENGDPVLKDVQTCEEPTPLFDWLLYPDNPGALIPTPPWVLCPA